MSEAPKFTPNMTVAPFYQVITCYGPKLVNDERIIVPATSDDWDELANDIWNGNLTEVVKVFRVDLNSGLVDDLTEEMAETLMKRSWNDQVEPDDDAAWFIKGCGRDYYVAPPSREREPHWMASRGWGWK